MIQHDPLPSKKVLILPIIHIQFIVFLAIQGCLLLIVFLISFVPSITTPKNVKEALDHPGWRQAMNAKM